MPVESATYISDLNASNPAGGDQKSEGDDHIRLVKAVIKATFPNINGAVTATPGQLNGPANLAAVTASGTSVEFTGDTSSVRRITVMVSGLSTSGTANIEVQIGDSGGYETTGYAGIVRKDSANSSLSSSFVIFVTPNASRTHSGALTLSLLDAASNTWTAVGGLGDSIGSVTFTSGSKSLSAALDRIRLYAGGSDTFDAGTVNVQFE